MDKKRKQKLRNKERSGSIRTTRKPESPNSRTLGAAKQNLVSIREGEAAKDPESHIEEAVGDKGYHNNQVLLQGQERAPRFAASGKA